MRVYLFGKDNLNQNANDLDLLLQQLLKQDVTLVLNQKLKGQVEGYKGIVFKNINDFIFRISTIDC